MFKGQLDQGADQGDAWTHLRRRGICGLAIA